MTETIYGVLSDIHQNPQIITYAIKVLKDLGAEKLLVNGDVSDKQETLEETQKRMAIVLNEIGKSGLESFVQPGSHEGLMAYVPVVDYFADKHSNLFSVQNVTQIQNDGHQLIFIPGSDSVSGGEFRFGTQLPSGLYVETNQGLRQLEDMDEYLSIANKINVFPKAFQYTNVEDTRQYVKEPEKTIVVCHVPRKFGNLETSVDMAEFGEAVENFNLNGQKIKKGSVFPIQIARKIKGEGAPVELKRENQGNEDLRTLYDSLGITKAVSGHFHESGHRACDSNGNPVGQGELTGNLFCNSGYLDVGQAAILTVRGDCVSYRNVNVYEFINR